MAVDWNSISAIGAALSALVSAAALAVSLQAVRQAVAQNEANTLLQVLERNDRYARALQAATSQAEQEVEFLNVLSFNESLAFMYNRGLATPTLKLALRKIIAAFVAGSQVRYDFDQVLAVYSIAPDQYAELRRFMRSHARELAAHRERLRDSVFVQRWSEADGQAAPTPKPGDPPPP